MNNAIIDVTGAITAVTVGSFMNSRLFDGYSGPDDGSGTFTAGGDIGTFKVTGKTNAFSHSYRHRVELQERVDCQHRSGSHRHEIRHHRQ